MKPTNKISDPSWQDIHDRDNRISELEAENQRLDAHAKEWGIKAQRAEQQLAEAQADAERLAWAKNNPRQFYEICQETLMSCVDEDVAIDAAMEGQNNGRQQS